MNYFNYFTILVLLLPLLVISTTISSPASFGAEGMDSVITPSSSICCKNETSFSPQAPSSSSSVTSPLKKISTQEENPQKQIDVANADTATSSELDSTPDSSTSALASPSKKIDTNKNNIITPLNSFSPQAPSSSSSVTSPLKKISTQEENPQKQIDVANADTATSSELDSTPDSSTSALASPSNRLDGERKENSSDSFPIGPAPQLNEGDNDNESNLSDMIKNNLDKLLYSDYPKDSTSDESSSDESSSDESSSDESSSDESSSDESSSDESSSDESNTKLEELQLMISNVFS
jgi:hypothetical protein